MFVDSMTKSLHHKIEHMVGHREALRMRKEIEVEDIALPMGVSFDEVSLLHNSCTLLRLSGINFVLIHQFVHREHGHGSRNIREL